MCSIGGVNLSSRVRDENVLLPFEDICRQDPMFENITMNLETYYDILTKLLLTPNTKSMYNEYIRHVRSHTYVKKSVLLYIYNKYYLTTFTELPTNPKFTQQENDIRLRKFLQTKPSRNMSGVTVVTVLTAPFPDGQSFSCKHDCYYCPAEPNQPRSYLMSEPAVARANRNEFDARKQTLDRLNSLLMNGHKIDKIEFILEGGTFTEYPIEYLERFMRDLVYSVNTYFDGIELGGVGRGEKEHPNWDKIEKYLRKPLSIEEELLLNKTARARISGICIETRPDSIVQEPEWIIRFRKWGVTRVQLGVQQIYPQILEGVNRGHTERQASQGIELLKNNGFKVDIHLMPDLPGSSPELDTDMFKEVYHGVRFHADQIKIYPCQVVPWTRIEKWHESGLYQPYAETNWEEFKSVLKTAIAECPPWIRLPRVVRDIPNKYIKGGNKKPNLRQILMDELSKEGRHVMEIRSRECGRNLMENIENAQLTKRVYETPTGVEIFISFETPRAIFGFCRLRLPNPEYEITTEDVSVYECRSDYHPNMIGSVFPELKNMALIRELHVYGFVQNVGEKNTSSQQSSSAQHYGLGKKLLKCAEELAKNNNYDGVAVISGCGVEEYYEKRGYSRNYDNVEAPEYFMKKYFKDDTDIMAYMLMFILIIFIGVSLVVDENILYYGLISMF